SAKRQSRLIQRRFPTLTLAVAVLAAAVEGLSPDPPARWMPETVAVGTPARVASICRSAVTRWPRQLASFASPAVSRAMVCSWSWKSHSRRPSCAPANSSTQTASIQPSAEVPVTALREADVDIEVEIRIAERIGKIRARFAICPPRGRPGQLRALSVREMSDRSRSAVPPSLSHRASYGFARRSQDGDSTFRATRRTPDSRKSEAFGGNRSYLGEFCG